MLVFSFVGFTLISNVTHHFILLLKKLPFLSFKLHAAFYCEYAMFYFPRKCSHSIFYIPVTNYSSDKIILQLFVKLFGALYE